MKQFQQKIQTYLDETKDKTAVLIQPLNSTTPLFEKDSQVQLVSASTIKVPIMCCALHEVLLHKLELDQMIPVTQQDILADSQVFEDGPVHMSLLDLIYWMIITSDNTATNVLIKTLGMDTINEYIQTELKVNKTKVERIMLDYEAVKQGRNNYTSQQDQMIIYTKLFNHEILNKELCDLALEILYTQRCQDLIMRYIPYPVPYAHKTGGLDYLIHDCGVMTINHQHYYIGFSAYECEDINGNTKLAGTIGKFIYDTLKEYNHV